MAAPTKKDVLVKHASKLSRLTEVEVLEAMEAYADVVRCECAAIYQDWEGLQASSQLTNLISRALKIKK